MMFYMDVRYDGDNRSETPDLLLSNDTIPSSNHPFSNFLGGHYQYQLGTPATMGKLCDLLSWHYADPVSQHEIRRNNEAVKFQGNRNPFVDRQAF